MKLQQITKEQAYEALKTRLPSLAKYVHPSYMQYLAWPQTFSSTAGPFGGVGGQAMTTFTIEAWEANDIAIIFCGDKILRIVSEWDGPNTVRL